MSQSALKYALAICERPALCTQANRTVAGAESDMTQVGCVRGAEKDAKAAKDVPVVRPITLDHRSADPFRTGVLRRQVGIHLPFELLSSPLAMAKTCDLGKCPGSCRDAEIVVTCTGNKLGAMRGGVHCRFGSLAAAACVYEEESGTLCCSPPKVGILGFNSTQHATAGETSDPPPPPSKLL